jgi:hypothetical protein
MRDARYPLAAARTQREVARQQAEAELRAARNRLAETERQLESARAACAAHRQRRVRTLTPVPTSTPSETRESADERVSAAALARSGAFAARLQRETAGLAEQLAAATRSVAEHRRALRLAELAWQRAHAEHETIERHHERFREAKRKAAERAYELEVEERAQTTQVLARS